MAGGSRTFSCRRESELFWNKKAKDILEGTGAKDVSSTGEASADYNKSGRSHRA
jgi:hypothetical protein